MSCHTVQRNLLPTRVERRRLEASAPAICRCGVAFVVMLVGGARRDCVGWFKKKQKRTAHSCCVGGACPAPVRSGGALDAFLGVWFIGSDTNDTGNIVYSSCAGRRNYPAAAALANNTAIARKPFDCRSRGAADPLGQHCLGPAAVGQPFLRRRSSYGGSLFIVNLSENTGHIRSPAVRIPGRGAESSPNAGMEGGEGGLWLAFCSFLLPSLLSSLNTHCRSTMSISSFPGPTQAAAPFVRGCHIRLPFAFFLGSRLSFLYFFCLAALLVPCPSVRSLNNCPPRGISFRAFPPSFPLSMLSWRSWVEVASLNES